MTPADPLPGYVLEAPLGQGATGTVHLARRADWAGRVVAVKRVPEAGDGLVALRREAEVLAALDHPHIVRVLDLVPDGAGVAIAMQYAAGGSLADLLAVRGRLTPGEVVAVAAPVADALASAHRRGLAHCDVKPANVLLTSDGEPLLSDFGLSRRVAGGAASPGGVAGTPEYLDPAVAAGAPPGPWSDVYGLGAVCYHALAGRPPFDGPTPEAVVAGVLAAPPAPLAGCAPGAPPALVDAVERAMARRPADRFPDAAAFAAALRAAAPAVPLVPAPSPPAPHDPPAGRPVVDPRHPAADHVEADVVGNRPHPPREPAPPGQGGGAGPLTRTFGPRPPRPAAAPPSTPRGGRRRARVGLAAGVAAAVAVVVAAGVGHAGGKPAAGAPRCAVVRAALRADVDGDGCPSAVSWRGDVAAVEGRRFQLGRVGDVLLVGDWDCDGTATPALYRPATGQVFLFDVWAGAGAGVTARPGDPGRAAGAATVARAEGGCDRVVVR